MSTQMVMARLEELAPRDRIPMLYLIDAIVQVRVQRPNLTTSFALTKVPVDLQNSRREGSDIYCVCVGECLGKHARLELLIRVLQHWDL